MGLSSPYQYQTHRKKNKNVGPIFRSEAARFRTESTENRPEGSISGFRGLISGILITPSFTVMSPLRPEMGPGTGDPFKQKRARLRPERIQRQDQSWDSVLFWSGRYRYSVLENGYSVSVFRYFTKTSHSVSVFRYCIRYLRKQTYMCKKVLKHL